MALIQNLSGTSVSSFKIGKGGPTIRQSTISPNGGNDGDIWIVTGSPQQLYQKISGSWVNFIPAQSNSIDIFYLSSAIQQALYQTGDIKPALVGTVPTGWVFLDGKTIGNASSGGTSRANSDTQNLFTFLWNNLANTEAPVSSGRGANASADFSANKTITLPDLRGRTIIGKDNMGGTAANRVTNAVSGIDATTVGKSGGDQNLQSHSHSYNGWTNGGAALGILGAQSFTSLTSGTAGTGNSQNMPPSYVANWLIKL